MSGGCKQLADMLRYRFFLLFYHMAEQENGYLSWGKAR